MQKRPDPLRQEATLRRLFPADKLERVVYYEQVVLADSKTLVNIGYEMAIITQDELFHLDLTKVKEPEDVKGIPLKELDLVEQLPDTAAFFAADVAKYTRHIRVHISDQVGIPSALDMYTYFEDTQLFYFLRCAWLTAKMREALSPLYETKPSATSPLSLLPSAASAAVLYATIKQAYLNYPIGFIPPRAPTDTLNSGPSAESQALLAQSQSKGRLLSPSPSTSSLLSPRSSSSPHLPSSSRSLLRSPSSPTASSSSSPDATSAMMDMSPQAIDKRVTLIVNKMRQLENLISCLCTVRGYTFQRLVLTQPDILVRLFDELQIASTHGQYYFAAAYHAHFGGNLLSQQSNNKTSPGNTDNTGNKSSVLSTPATGSKSISSGTNNTSSSSNSGSGSNKSTTVSGDTSFSSELEVYQCRQGHPAEELVRLEYLLSLLIVINMAINGSHCLGGKRFSFLPTSSTSRFADVINCLTLVNPDLLKPTGKAQILLEVARRRRAYEVRKSYQSDLRDALIKSAYGDSTAESAAKYQIEQEDKMEADLFDRIKLKLFEIDNQYALIIYNLIDVAKQSHTTREGTLSPDQVINHILSIPDFITARIPALFRRGCSLLSQRPSPTVGYFIYIILDVLCTFTSRSAPLRLHVNQVCSDYIQFELSRRETSDKLMDAPYFFYRQSVSLLKSLLRILASDGDF